MRTPSRLLTYQHSVHLTRSQGLRLRIEPVPRMTSSGLASGFDLYLNLEVEGVKHTEQRTQGHVPRSCYPL